MARLIDFWAEVQRRRPVLIRFGSRRFRVTRPFWARVIRWLRRDTW